MSGKLKAVILGCGNIAGGYDEKAGGAGVWTHAKAYQNLANVEIVGAFDPDQGRLSAFCQRWGIGFAASDLNSLMERCRPEIVSICSPNEVHYPQFKDVLPFGPKAVLCEKPLAMQPTQAREMAESAQSRGILLCVNYLRRWDSALLELGEKIRSGKYGRCLNARVYYTKGVFHNASHAINLFQHWFGEFEEAAVRGSSPAGSDLLADFSLRFERCPDAVFQACDAEKMNVFSIELTFDGAFIRLPGGGASMEIQLPVPSAMASGTSVPGPVQAYPGTISTAMQAVADNLVDTLQGKGSLRMKAEEAVATVEICERVRLLARS